jgi:dihydrofolate reductase
MIIGIVAIDQNFAIGKAGKLPWHYSSDLKFFKQTTVGHTVAMGRKTFDSIGKALPNRLNIVLSRGKEIQISQSIFVNTKENVLELAKYVKGNLFIIGGASIYAEFADVIEKWIVTEVPLIVKQADAFMPKNFLDNFEMIEKTELEANLFVKVYKRKF